jgi:WD40 repeat protein
LCHPASLTSLDIAKNDTLMVTADNVGFITLWDVNKLRQCLTQSREFQAIPPTSANHQFVRIEDCADVQLGQWQAGHQGSAIRDIALTDNGCYLASTGDDGRISLWRLNKTGARSSRSNPINIAAFPGTSLNSVDIHLTTNNVVLIAADTADHRVQLYRKQLKNHDCQ